MILMGLAAALASTSAPVGDAFDLNAKKVGIVDRYNRGVITRQRDDASFTVAITPSAQKWDRYIFTIAVFNKSGKPINVDASNVSVLMLDGSTVPALSAERVKKIAKNRAGWAQFGQAMVAAMAGASAYGTTTSTTHAFGGGYAGGRSFRYAGYSHTQASYYDPTAAAINAAENRRAMDRIQAGLDDLIANVNDAYLSTTTVDANEGFAGQVMIDKIKFTKRRDEKSIRRQFLMRVDLAGTSYDFPFSINTD